MTISWTDARLEEIALLSEVERANQFELTPCPGPERDLVVFLVARRYVNDLNVEWQHPVNLVTALPGESQLERLLHAAHIGTMSRVLGGEKVTLQLTHLGRVRLAELRQAVQTGRIREEFNILWDGRHFETDARLALLDVRDEHPLAAAFLDMNGLKEINDTYGHAAGSAAIRAYFYAVVTVLQQRGEAYRKGGDEVLVLLPSTPSEDARAIVKKICLLLMRERVRHGETSLPQLSISAGIVATKEYSLGVAELYRRSDEAMYRAKEKSKEATPRPSCIAIWDERDVDIAAEEAAV